MRSKLLFTILATTMLIATALQSAEIIPIWNKGSGAGDIQDIEFLKGHNEFVLLVGVGSNAQLQVRTTETGELLNTIPVGTSTNSRIVITPDSTRIIHLNGGIAQVRNISENFSVEGYFGVDSDSIIYGFTDIAIDPIRPLAYVTVYGWKGAHPNITTKSKVSVYNYETKEFIQDLTELGDYEYSVIEVSDDGKYLAVLNDGKAFLKVWDLETTQLIVNEKLYSDSDEVKSDARDIKFSKSNKDIIYLSGTFTQEVYKDKRHGTFIYNMNEKKRSLVLPDVVYSSTNLILLDNETRIFNSSRSTIGILDLIKSVKEWYNFPPENVYSQIVKYSVNSNYFIGITANNISKFLYDSQSNIEDIIEEEILISPNPTSRFINIDMNCTEPLLNYQIYDVNGVMVYQSSAQNQASNLQIDFTIYPTGIYFLTLNCNNSTKTYKIIKEG
ncbi:MAG: T9SS type A sorting domain-containing protein [Candidatus Kapaibacterium sp.]|nr:T9SS type A sorting domain-containing protein [Ignavibacteriota bacterium]MCB9221494.1 T9SS type A sorting domain-containing protein [Ignavibacteria bacterium]